MSCLFCILNLPRLKSQDSRIDERLLLVLKSYIVRAYNIERTLCDCLRYIDKLDRDLVLTALKRYAKHKDRDSLMLLEYASVLKIRDVVYRYLEVLM